MAAGCPHIGGSGEMECARQCGHAAYGDNAARFGTRRGGHYRNDVAALTDEGALALLARQPDTGICLMHMRGLPENMQDNPQYGDVAGEVARYLSDRAEACMEAGIAAEQLVLDPGFGFGKNLQHNI